MTAGGAARHKGARPQTARAGTGAPSKDTLEAALYLHARRQNFQLKSRSPERTAPQPHASEVSETRGNRLLGFDDAQKIGQDPIPPLCQLPRIPGGPVVTAIGPRMPLQASLPSKVLIPSSLHSKRGAKTLTKTTAGEGRALEALSPGPPQRHAEMHILRELSPSLSPCSTGGCLAQSLLPIPCAAETETEGAPRLLADEKTVPTDSILCRAQLAG